MGDDRQLRREALDVLGLALQKAARDQQRKRIAFGVIATVAAYCIIVNLAIAVAPAKQWTPAQTARFVSLQQTIGPQSLASTVRSGANLPYWAPAGQLFITGQCSGLYLSTGFSILVWPAFT